MTGISADNFLKIIAKSDCNMNLPSLSNATDGSTTVLVLGDECNEQVDYEIVESKLQAYLGKLVRDHDHCYFNKTLVKYSDIPGTNCNTEASASSNIRSVGKRIKNGKTPDETHLQEEKSQEKRKKRMKKIMYYKRRIETERELANYYTSQTLEIRSAIRKLKRQTEDYQNVQKQKLFLWDFD